jgi:predicted transcriptional regulator
VISQHKDGQTSISRRRDEIEIVVDILRIAENGARKTRVLYLGNLNTVSLEKYISLLRQRRLLEFDSNRNIYWTTPTGKEFIKKFEECLMHKEIHSKLLVELLSVLNANGPNHDIENRLGGPSVVINYPSQ